MSWVIVRDSLLLVSLALVLQGCGSTSKPKPTPPPAPKPVTPAPTPAPTPPATLPVCPPGIYNGFCSFAQLNNCPQGNCVGGACIASADAEIAQASDVQCVPASTGHLHMGYVEPDLFGGYQCPAGLPFKCTAPADPNPKWQGNTCREGIFDLGFCSRADIGDAGGVCMAADARFATDVQCIPSSRFDGWKGFTFENMHCPEGKPFKCKAGGTTSNPWMVSLATSPTTLPSGTSSLTLLGIVSLSGVSMIGAYILGRKRGIREGQRTSYLLGYQPM